MPEQLTVTKSEPLSVVSSDVGSWEDRGIGGMVWHPPGVAAGQDATAQRLDANIVGWGEHGAGIAPEDVLMGGQAVRKIGGAVLNSGIRAGVTEAVAHASPIIKYEVARHTLTGIGIPNAIATPIAMVISGYSRGAKTEPGSLPAPADPAAPHLDTSVPVKASDLTPQQLAERVAYGRDFGPRAAPVEKPPLGSRLSATAPPVDVAPVASPPVAPAPLADPGTPAPAPTSPAASTWSPQRIRNEVGLAARRAKLSLSDDQLAQADALVRQGQSPPSAVRTVAPPPPVPKLKVSAAEMAAYTKLRRAGKSESEAIAALQMQRDLAASLGSPTSEAVRQAVEERNATGRWPANWPPE
jgi:hypothetical protein